MKEKVKSFLKCNWVFIFLSDNTSNKINVTFINA